LDAVFSLEATQGGFDVIIDSRSGTNRAGAVPRNPDYENLFELVLRRAANLDASLTGAWVESRETRDLSLDDRLLRAPQFPYPVHLRGVPDMRMLRTTIAGRQGAIGRKPGARGPGNRNKRVRLSFQVPDVLDELAFVQAIVLGESPRVRADLAAVLPETDTAASRTTDLARIARLLTHYEAATPEARTRATRAVERGPIGKLLKRAHGYRCQVCAGLGRQEATFSMPDGNAYVEAHHIVHVADGVAGSLRPENVIIVCAAHHRELHYGASATVVDKGDHFEVNVELGTVSIRKPDLLALLAGAA
jgi:hypothetical protein